MVGMETEARAWLTMSFCEGEEDLGGVGREGRRTVGFGAGEMLVVSG